MVKIMVDEKMIEKIYREKLDENIISYIAEKKNIGLDQAMDAYFRSKLSKKINQGLYGVQYLDYRNLAQILFDTEPEAFIDVE